MNRSILTNIAIALSIAMAMAMAIPIPIALTGLLSTSPAIAQHDQHDQHDQHGQHGQHDTHDQPGSSLADRALGQQEGSSSLWTCPMHPQVVQDQAGTCPICGMDLVARQQQRGPNTAIEISGPVRQLMNLRTASVQRGRLFRRIDTIGRIQVDESRLIHRHPRVEGWLGELDIAAEGDPVRAGDRLYTLYSRELVNIQEEWLQALLSGRQSTASAARQRLEVLDVQPGVLDRIERERERLDYIPWYAERDGYVSRLNVRAGMYVAPGTEIMQIASSESVWLIADIHGGQIDWLAPGQVVHIERDSHPGEQLRGPLDFIYPELDPITRTARARVLLDNSSGTLRPGDWARVRILAGPRENLLYLPSEALIRTGTDTRVIVQDEAGRFSPRSVHAGMESGEFTEIIHGLDAGEEVVTSGQFLIDSEASIRAGHSRISSHDH